MDSFLEAIQGNYGGAKPTPDDLTSVRGLLVYCKKWCSGLLTAEELHNPCLAMAGRLRAAASSTDIELEGSPEMAEALVAPIERTADAYEVIADILEELPILASESRSHDFLDALEEFEQERQAVLDAKSLIAKQLQGSRAICPRCASSGSETSCPQCELVRLFPDPEAGNRADLVRVELRGPYHRLFRCYTEVVTGQRSLPTLEAALTGLRAHLRAMLQAGARLRKSSLAGTEEAIELATRLQPDVEKALSGVQRMEECLQSRALSDLHRGWEDVFDAAVIIENGVRRFKKRPPTTLERPTDSISLSNEILH